jgi:cytoskeletal protein CcmA (bactofilin family)
MFRKKSSNQKSQKIETILGENSEFKGCLSFEGGVRIEGKFEGEIRADGDLIIGEDAVVKANISAGTVIIGGKVHGNVSSSERLELQPQGELIGDITAPMVSIAEGSVFQGKCIIEQKPTLSLTDLKGESGEKLDFQRLSKK